MTIRRALLILALLVVLVGGVGGVVAWRKIAPYKEDAKLTQTVRGALSGLSGDFAVGRAYWLAFPRTLVIEDFEVQVDGRRVIYVEKAIVSLGFSTPHDIKISSVGVTGLEVFVLSDAQGHSLFQRAFAPRPTSGGGGDGKKTTVTIAHVEGPVAYLGVETSAGRIDLTDRKLNSDRVTVQAGKDGSQVELAGVVLSSDDLRVTTSGNITSDRNETTLNLSATARLPLAEVHHLVPEDLRALLDPTGTVKSDEITITGPSEVPVVAGTIEVTDTAFADIPVPRIAGHYEVGPETTTVEGVRVELGGGSAEVSGSIGTGAADAPYDFEVVAEKLPLRQLAAPFTDPTQIPERYTGGVTVAGKTTPGSLPETLRIDGTFSGRPPALPTLVPDTFFASGTAKIDGVTSDFESLTAKSDHLTLELTGKVPVQEGAALDARVTVTDSAPTETLRTLDQELTARSARVVGRLSGTLEDLGFDGHLSARGLTQPGLPAAADVETDLALHNGSLSIESGRASFPDGGVDVSGSIALLDEQQRVREHADARLRLQGKGLQLGVWSQGIASGLVDFESELNGPIDALSGPIRVETGELTLGQATFPRGHGTLEMRKSSEVRVSRFVVETPGGGALSADGAVQLSDGTYGIDLGGNDVPLSTVLRAGNQAWPFEKDSASKTITGHVSGGPERIQYDAALAGPAGRLSVEGEYLPEGEHITFRATGDLPVPAWVALAGSEEPVAGTVHATLEGAGVLPYPDMKGRVEVHGVSYNDHALGNSRVEIDVETDADRNLWIARAGLLGLGDARIEVERKDPLAAVASITFKDLPIHELVPEEEEQPVVLTATGIATARYVVDKGLEFATIQMNDVQAGLKDGKDRIRNTEPVFVTFDGIETVVPEFRLEGPKGWMSAGGSIADSVDLSVRAEAALGDLPLVLPDVMKASGRIALTASLTGSLDAPVLNASTKLLDPAALRVRQMAREVTLDSADLVVENNQARIDSLTGRIGAGAFQATGNARLEKLIPKDYDFRLLGTAIPIEAQDVAVAANIAGRVQPGPKGPNISGRVDVLAGRYRRKFELKSFNFVARDPLEPPAAMSSFMANVGLDVRINATEPIAFEVDAGTFALDLQLVADLDLSGTAAVPRLGGRVSAQRGVLAFPRAKLDVLRANVDFNPADLDMAADIDLVAEGEVDSTTGTTDSRTYIANVALEGNLNEMQLGLTSDPPLTPVEVLSLLVTGYVNPADVTGVPGSPAEQATLDAALAFTGAQLADPITKLLTDRLERMLNLRLDVGTEVTSSGARVSVRKQLTERLMLEGSFEQTFGGVSAAHGAARFYLSDRVFIEGRGRAGDVEEGSTDSNGEEGRVEMRWRVIGD